MNDAGQAIIALGVCATVATAVITFGRAYVRGIEAQRFGEHGSAAGGAPQIARRTPADGTNGAGGKHER